MCRARLSAAYPSDPSHTPTAKISPPNYDGTTAWEIYKTQFEAAANANHWTEQQKATSLVVALQGKEAELLQSLTTMDQGNYAAFAMLFS
ncbi:hypothetical protein HUJ05_002934 [Dendroctonus ponderosae]|nr:hypothetical protein HUJ05_002934 [Dendroctonus ponderosae]